MNTKHFLKNFLTKQRIEILLASWLAAALLFVIAWLWIPTDNIWNSLFVNLSASGFLMGITIIVIDYLLGTEKQLSVADGLELANEEIGLIFSQIDVSLTQLFGFDVNGLTFPKYDKNAQDPIAPILRVINTARNTYLDQMMDVHDTKTINFDKVKDYSKRLQGSMSEMDIILNRYSYALSNKDRGNFLKARKNLKVIIQILDILSIKTGNESAKKTIATYHLHVKKSFPEYYK
jgi:hypothetical protein